MHTIIKDSKLNGWEYGMQRCFEKAITEETGATICKIPEYSFLLNYINHFGHGMKRSKFRKHFPKQSWSTTGDVGWYILMGPENYRLDLYKDWDRNLKTKILYLYDTFPSQYSLIKRICKDEPWDILITSFNDAVEDLQKITGRRWHCVEQAADKDIFSQTAFTEKLIHFSSYGRRFPAVHEIVKEFCDQKGLYYDFTTHDGRHPVVDSSELYAQYAWHLNHSLFTFSWPVEFTNPIRAGHLHPITCRWFEALAAGSIILGRKPGNDIFKNWLSEDLVTEFDPTENRQNQLYKLNQIWENREKLYDNAQMIRSKKAHVITWNERVRTIIKLIDS